MGLFETRSTLRVGVGEVERVGHCEIIYECDGCSDYDGTKGLDPDAPLRLAGVTLDGWSGPAVATDLDDWTFFYDEPGEPCTRSYCPECSAAREAATRAVV